jgi:hypothetical protein
MRLEQGKRLLSHYGKEDATLGVPLAAVSLLGSVGGVMISNQR